MSVKPVTSTIFWRLFEFLHKQPFHNKSKLHNYSAGHNKTVFLNLGGNSIPSVITLTSFQPEHHGFCIMKTRVFWPRMIANFVLSWNAKFEVPSVQQHVSNPEKWIAMHWLHWLHCCFLCNQLQSCQSVKNPSQRRKPPEVPTCSNMFTLFFSCFLL